MAANTQNDISAMLDDTDAVLVTFSNGKTLYSENADIKLVPASILKIFTSLVSIHTLGRDYRFKTEFYLDKDHHLKIKGFGDPLLTSEALADIADLLARRIDSFNDILIDDSFFMNPIIIPGTSGYSIEPYDAPNNALSVNFNTVNFRRSHNGGYISAEPQTPLLPFILPRIAASSLGKGRIILSRDNDEIALYAGHLIRWFLKSKGINSTGRIRRGRVSETEDKLVLRYLSNIPMEDLITRLLLYSNNFIAGQMLVTAGAEMFGPPGTLEKGLKAARKYADCVLKIKDHDLDLKEGSGISRQNRMSAKTFIKVLEAFEPYRYLMRREGTVFYKTGTLDGISTRAGYIEQSDGSLFYYVIMMNTPGKSTKPVMKKILQLVSKQSSPVF